MPIGRHAPALLLTSGIVSLFGVAACAELDPLDTGCGNAVVEEGEDCDPGTQSAPNPACGLPDSGATACRFTCTPATTDSATGALIDEAPCPDPFTCGQDGICRRPRGLLDPNPLAVTGGSIPVADDLGDSSVGDELLVTSDQNTFIYGIGEDRTLVSSNTVPVGSESLVIDDLRPETTGSTRKELALIVPQASLNDPALIAVLERSSADAYISLPFDSVQVQAPGAVQSAVFTGGRILGEQFPIVVTNQAISVLVSQNEVATLVSLVEPLAGFAIEPDPDIVGCDIVYFIEQASNQVRAYPLCREGAMGGPRRNVGEGATMPQLRATLPETIAVRPSPNPVKYSSLHIGDFRFRMMVADGEPPSPEDVGEGADFLISATCPGNRNCIAQARLANNPPDVATPPDVAKPVVVAGDVNAETEDNCRYEPTAVEDGFVAEIEKTDVNSPAGARVLAVADVNGDGNVDFANEAGLFVSLGERNRYLIPLCTGKRWDSAVFADLNKDGALDLVVGEAAPPLETAETLTDLKGGPIRAYINNGTGSFGSYEVNGVSGDLVTVADFDGDNVDDIIYLERSVGSFQRLGYVSYGRTDGGPELPGLFGVFEGEAQIASGQLVGRDAPADLLVVTALLDEGGGPLVNTTVFAGSTSRLLVSPLLLLGADDIDLEEASVPVLATAGNFQSGEQVTLAVLSQDGEVAKGEAESFSVWDVTLHPEGSETTASPPVAGAAIEVFGERLDEVSLFGLSVDVLDDDTGRDELLIVLDNQIEFFTLTDGRFELVASDAGEASFTLTGAASARPLVTDLDGDGREDIVAPVRVLDDTSLEEFLQIEILWNDPTGLTSQTVQPSGGGDAGFRSITAVASMNILGDERDDIIVLVNEFDELGPASLSVVTLDRERQVDLVQSIDVPGNFSGSQLAAGDFDGDGLDDLVVANQTANTSFVFFGQDAPGSGGPSTTPGSEAAAP
ncbi:MAG: VCBS repeat-containing protein [Myxococcota bacterium]